MTLYIIISIIAYLLMGFGIVQIDRESFVGHPIFKLVIILTWPPWMLIYGIIQLANKILT